MTEAYAIKSPTGSFLELGLSKSDLYLHPTDEASGYTCVKVTVSEKGEALLPGLELAKDILQKNDCKSWTVIDMQIATLKANLSRGQVCEHGKALNEYCQPCGRIHGD